MFLAVAAPLEGRCALSGGVQDRGRAELVVGLELGRVVQLLQGAIARVAGMIPGVGQDVPWRAAGGSAGRRPEMVAPRVLGGEAEYGVGPVDGQQRAELTNIAGQRDAGEYLGEQAG